MNRLHLCLALLTLVLAACASRGPIALRPAQPADMTVVAGEQTLHFEPPIVVEWSTEGAVAAPRSHASWYDPWQPWPRRGKDRKANTIELGPRHDETGTPILGGLFRSVQPESIVVRSADGSKTFAAGEDYLVNAEWGQIANLDERLGEPWADQVQVSCRYALQRLDLVQRAPDGGLSVKVGSSTIVCPRLPAPDSACEAVAGVYIAPWRREGRYAITAEDIFPINPAPPAAPVNPEALAGTLAKLRAGEAVKIALVGASITLGAESTQWWRDQGAYGPEALTWRGRVIHTLRHRYPEAEITPIEAFQGGTSTEYGLEQFRQIVQPAEPDLAIVSFGGNDAGGPIGGEPHNSPEKFKALLSELVAGIRASGCEVMILVTMPRNPWSRNGVPQRWPLYRQAMLEVADEQGVALADVHADWEKLAKRGIPAFSQLHNWNNHPGDFGHALFAETILRFFPEQP